MVERHDGKGVYTKTRMSCLILVAYTVVIGVVAAGLAIVLWR